MREAARMRQRGATRCARTPAAASRYGISGLLDCDETFVPARVRSLLTMMLFALHTPHPYRSRLPSVTIAVGCTATNN